MLFENTVSRGFSAKLPSNSQVLVELPAWV